MTAARTRATIVAMETTVHEIADGFYRLSTYLPDVTPAGFTFNQFLVDAERAAAVPLRPARAVPAGVRGRGRGCMPVERAALDHLRPRRGRRVRLDEPVARRRARGAGGARRAGLHGLDRRHGRPAAAAAGRRRGARHRRAPAAPDLHPARAARLGGAGPVRRDDRHAAVRRPVHPGRATAPALVHDTDMVGPALAAEDMFHDTCLTAVDRRRRCARWPSSLPATLALMHGPSFAGDCAAALRDLADGYAERLALAGAAAQV